MCVGKALSHNFATVTLPVSEAPNWLGAGTPSAPGVTVAHPSANWIGKKHTGRVHPKATSWAVGRRGAGRPGRERRPGNTSTWPWCGWVGALLRCCWRQAQVVSWGGGGEPARQLVKLLDHRSPHPELTAPPRRGASRAGPAGSGFAALWSNGSKSPPRTHPCRSPTHRSPPPLGGHLS